VSGVGEVMLSK